MKRFIALLLPFALAIPLVAQTPPPEAENNSLNKIRVTFAPTAWHMFGETQYDFMQTFQSVDLAGDTILVTGRSLLEFPLDVLMVGGSLEIKSSPQTSRFWSVEVGIFANINDPGNLMRDSDWIRVPGVFNEKVSFTESNAKMDMFLINAEATRQIFILGNIDLAILAGFRYQNIKQAIIGFDGWFLDTSFVRQPQSGSAAAIDYEVTYMGPRIGILARMDFKSLVQIDLKTALSLVWADDFDDHLLRKFHTFADGTGLGILSNMHARWFPGSSANRKRPYIELFSNLDYFSADIKQTFEQYADGGPSELPPGTTISNLPHDLQSIQFSVGLRVGLAF